MSFAKTAQMFQKLEHQLTENLTQEALQCKREFSTEIFDTNRIGTQLSAYWENLVVPQ